MYKTFQVIIINKNIIFKVSLNLTCNELKIIFVKELYIEGFNLLRDISQYVAGTFELQTAFKNICKRNILKISMKCKLKETLKYHLILDR